MEIQALTPIDKLKEKLITMTDGILSIGRSWKRRANSKELDARMIYPLNIHEWNAFV